MSNAVSNNLSRKKVQELLAAAGSEATQDDTQIETTEYNWHQPHCFDSDQLKKLDNLTQKTAAAIAKKFADLYHSDFNATIVSTTLHFADELLEQVSTDETPQAESYCLTFTTDQEHPCGLISIPAQTAVKWITQLLGDGESAENADRDLSQLEESLLLDIAAGLIEAFSYSCGTGHFDPGKEIIKAHLPLELAEAQELCKITFNIKKADSEDGSEAHFLILCHKLEPVLGKNTQPDRESPAEDSSTAIMSHVRQMPISVTAQLASGVFTFEQIMTLEADDILLLDKNANEPVELIVEGRTLLRGRPVKSDGKYAVAITELCNQK